MNKKINKSEKCKDCFANQEELELGNMCVAPMCIKEYDYDSESRTYIKKKREIENQKDLNFINEYKMNKEVIKKALEMYKTLVSGLSGFFSWCLDEEIGYYELEDHKNLVNIALNELS